jgi:regulator of RNase E activity RraB
LGVRCEVYSLSFKKNITAKFKEVKTGRSTNLAESFKEGYGSFSNDDDDDNDDDDHDDHDDDDDDASKIIIL